MQKKDSHAYQPRPLTAAQRARKKEFTSTPIAQIDLSHTISIADLMEAFAGMSIQARNLGECAQVLKNLYADKARPTVMLGLAGPLIAGGLRKVIRDMIAYGLVDVVVSTGAIIYQDIYQARGYQHYKGSPDADDAKLRDLFIDRIYDTYVDEEKFWETDCWIGRFADTLSPRGYSSREFLALLGQRMLKDKNLRDENSILYTATKLGVPIFCPALNDSSIGIGLTEHYHRAKKEGRRPITIDAIRDNYEITQIVVKSKKTAAFYVAGGVPKNYINDSIVMSYIFGNQSGGHAYALQVTTDVPHWGGLSGSTLKEATSWGKISKTATRAMAFVEPTVSLPLLVGYCLQKKLYKGRRRINLRWDGDRLKGEI
ncbi:MAG: deoxyhypusine synthase family protein [Candidatus Margulisiibacteriota bacterium]